MVCCYFLEDFCINIQQFDYYVSQCRFLWAILLGVCWASFIYIFRFLINFGKLLAIISSNNHSSTFSLSSPSETFMMYILVYLMVSYKFLKFCWLFIHSCILWFFRLDHFKWLIKSFTDCFCLLEFVVGPLYWVFQFNYVVFLDLEFLFIFKK